MANDPRNFDTEHCTRDEALDYIRNRCAGCDLGSLAQNCSGADAARCNKNVERLVERFKKENSVQNTAPAEPTQPGATKTLVFPIWCQAHYMSHLEVPAELSLVDAFLYAEEHLDDAPFDSMLVYLDDSDNIDENDLDQGRFYFKEDEDADQNGQAKRNQELLLSVVHQMLVQHEPAEAAKQLINLGFLPDELEKVYKIDIRYIEEAMAVLESEAEPME